MDYKSLLPTALVDTPLFMGILDILEYMDTFPNVTYPDDIRDRVEKVFKGFGSVEAVSAWYTQGVYPLFGTKRCFDLIVRMYGIEVNVVEWWDSPTLPKWGVFFNFQGSSIPSMPNLRELLDTLLMVCSERTRIVAFGKSLPTGFSWDAQSEVTYCEWDRNYWEAFRGLTYRGVALTLVNTPNTIVVPYGSNLEGYFRNPSQYPSIYLRIGKKDERGEISWKGVIRGSFTKVSLDDSGEIDINGENYTPSTQSFQISSGVFGMFISDMGLPELSVEVDVIELVYNPRFTPKHPEGSYIDSQYIDLTPVQVYGVTWNQDLDSYTETEDFVTTGVQEEFGESGREVYGVTWNQDLDSYTETEDFTSFGKFDIEATSLPYLMGIPITFLIKTTL